MADGSLDRLSLDAVQSILRRLNENVINQGSVPEKSVRAIFDQLVSEVAVGSMGEQLVGGLGWILVNSKVERYQSDKIRGAMPTREIEEQRYDGLCAAANALLSCGPVLAFLASEYRLDTARLVQPLALRFFKAGTTSIILRTMAEPCEEAVLKVLKFSFVENPSITNATRMYGNKMKGVGRVRAPVPIGCAGERFILLPYVSGLTLREYVEDLAYSLRGESERSARLEVAQKVIIDLCLTLKAYARLDQFHHDLSPDNIILEGTDANGDHSGAGDVDKVWILDWGFNYLLGERVGSTAAVSLIQHYVDPELVEGHKTAALADLYSIGAILLELLAGKRLGMAQTEHGKTLAWELAAPLAELVDTLTDRDPTRRAPWEPGSSDYRVYDGLVDRLNLRFQMLQAANEVPNAWAITQSFIQLSTGLAVPLIVESFERLDRIRDLGPKFTETEEYRTLLSQSVWLIVAQVASFATGAIVLYSYFFGVFGQKTSLPAALVCYTFCVVAANYFMNIFGQLSTVGLGRRGNLAQGTIWFNSFCFAGPILYTTLHNPLAWPVCSALGVAFVAVNNIANFRVAKRANEVATDSDSDSTAAFLKSFRDWGPLVLAYAGSLALIGFALDRGVLQDELAYALLATAMNLKMIVSNVYLKAPETRAGLNRLYSNYRRTRKAEMQDRTSMGSPCTDTLNTTAN